jgi:hypothetical protein
MTYTNKASVKAYLDITGTGDDALFDSLINRAQEAINSFCGGRVFESDSNTTRNFTVGVDTEGRWLYLDEEP